MGGDGEEVRSAGEEFKGPLFCGNTGRATEEEKSSAMEKVRAEH